MAFLAEHWPWFVAGAVLLLIIVIVVIVVVRRRRKRPPAPARPPLDLRRAWKQFRSRMPQEHRRVLPLFRPFVVLGEPGTGKTSLIDRRSDWRGQAALFHPSFTEDPLLQVYQAARGVVQELSPAVLADSTPRARRALIKLWKPLRRHKDPRVVVVLSAASLRSAVPDALLKQAQAVRGKVDILAHVVGRPVHVTIALTHMDQIEGFLEISAVMTEEGIPMAFEPGELPTFADLQEAFAPLDAALPVVLRERSAADYVRALSFLRGLPNLLRPLSVFIDALQIHHPLAPAPPIGAIGLTSTKEGLDSTWDPFASAITQEEARRFRPWKRHLAAAALLFAVGAAWLYGGYTHELETVERGLRAVDTYVSGFKDPATRTQLFDLVAAAKDDPIQKLTPTWFKDDEVFAKQMIHARLVRQLREAVLLPRFARMKVEDQGVRAMYMLVLLAAGAGNEAGRHVLDNIDAWAAALELPTQLITDVVRNNRQPDQFALPIDERAFREAFTAPTVEPEDHSAADLARHVASAAATPLLDEQQVSALRDEAAAVVAELNAGRDVRRDTVVAAVLDTVTHKNFGEPWIEAAAATQPTDRDAVQAIQRMLSATDLGARGANTSTVAGLLDAIAKIQAEVAPADMTLRFQEGDGEVSVRTADWALAVKRTRLTRLVRAFTDEERAQTSAVFFGARPSYPAVRVDDGGGRFFTTAARVEGIYTARAFEEKVRLALEKLPAAIEPLPIADASKDAVIAYVKAAAEEHALAYSDAWIALFDAFDYSADSSLSLRLLLTELARAKSPLRKVLQEIARNTDLTISEQHPLLEPYIAVADTFAFIRSIVPKPGETSPVLDEYFSIIGKMQQDLSGDGAAAGAKADEVPTLATTLSPVGRMALAMYLDQEDSYQRSIDAWIASADIPADWQAPFELPTSIAYHLGISDVETRVNRAWEDTVSAHVEPLQIAFPFHPLAETAATPEQIEAAFHPTGPFWSTVDTMIAPVCTYRRGVWDARRSRLGSLQLPHGMVRMLNRLEPLKTRFWDVKGEPRALPLQARPLPLPGGTQQIYVTVLSHLQLGDTWVYGFNQRPDWADLKIEWWKRGPASVGAAFSLAGEGDKVYRGTSLQETDWGLYHLLKASTRQDPKTKTWEWRVAGPAAGRSVTVGFQLDRDPWAMLGLFESNDATGR